MAFSLNTILNYAQHNDIKQKDTDHIGTQHNDIGHISIQHNVSDHNYIQYNYNMLNDAQ